MVKVIVIAPSLPKYSEPWMARMTESLKPNVVFVALQGEKELEEKINGVDTFVIGKDFGPIGTRARSVFGRARITNKILSIIDSHRDESGEAVVLCHYLTTAVLLSPIWKDKSIKCVVHCHGHDVTWRRKVESMPFLPAHGFFYLKKVQRLIGQVKLIANSEATKKKVTDVGFPPEDVFVKYLGVDVSQIEVNSFKEKGPLTILYLGRLTDFKGPIETIKAFEMAKKDGFDGRLVIVGGGALLKACQGMASESRYSEDIKVVGPVDSDEALKFYKQAHIFTAHNKRSERTGQEEAFGVSIIEAMAHGLPVVTGASGGVLETVAHEISGYLIEPGNIVEHAKALNVLQRDVSLRKSMAINAREICELKFDSSIERAGFDKIFDVLKA